MDLTVTGWVIKELRLAALSPQITATALVREAVSRPHLHTSPSPEETHNES